MAKETVVTEKVGHGMAIVALLLNIIAPLVGFGFLFPWLGSLLGKHKAWKKQLILTIVGVSLILLGLPLMLLLIGFVMIPIGGLVLLGTYIWGIITGVQILKANPN